MRGSALHRRNERDGEARAKQGALLESAPSARTFICIRSRWEGRWSTRTGQRFIGGYMKMFMWHAGTSLCLSKWCVRGAAGKLEKTLASSA